VAKILLLGGVPIGRGGLILQSLSFFTSFFDGFHFFVHINASKLYDDYKRIPELRPQKEYDDALKKANDAKPMRDIGLCVGSALLAAGIAVHIWF